MRLAMNFLELNSRTLNFEFSPSFFFFFVPLFDPADVLRLVLSTFIHTPFIEIYVYPVFMCVCVRVNYTQKKKSGVPFNAFYCTNVSPLL